MATATKTLRTCRATATLAADTAANFAEVNLSTALGGLLTIKIVNDSTGPTTDTTITVYTGGATTVKKTFWEGTAGQDTDGVYEYSIDIPPGVMFLNGTITSGETTALVNAEAYLQELTSIG